METIKLTVDSFEDVGLNLEESIQATESEISEVRIKKIVNRRGMIRKQQTAGVSGRKIVNGKVHVINGQEKRAQRLGVMARRRKMKAKSSALKRRSALFAKLGRKKRSAMHVTDTRRG